MNWLKENWFKVSILSILSFSVYVIYQALPQIANDRENGGVKEYMEEDCIFAEMEAREKWETESNIIQRFSGHYSDNLKRCVVESFLLGENSSGASISSKILIDSRDQSAIAEHTTADGKVINTLSEKEYEELRRKILYDL